GARAARRRNGNGIARGKGHLERVVEHLVQRVRSFFHHSTVLPAGRLRQRHGCAYARAGATGASLPPPPLSRRELLEPAQHGVDARETPARDRRTVADLDRYAAERVHGAKTGLVRHVIAYENGRTARKRRLRHE